MDPIVTSGLISAGSNVASAGGSILSQALFGSRNERWAREDATTAYNRAVEQWNRENAYNTPKAQMQRFIDAGLNPSLIYGMMSGGSIGLPSVPQISTNQSVPSPIPQGLLDPILQSKLTKAQIDNLDSQSDLSRSQAWRIYKITPVEYDKIVADADSIRQMILSNEFQTKVNQLKSQKFDDREGLYIYSDEHGNPLYTDFRGLIMENEVTALYSSIKDYQKAIQLFYSEIGLANEKFKNQSLENQKLEEFVKVCARIYESDAAQADYLREVAEMNKNLFGNIGASREGIGLVFSVLQMLISAVK